MTKTVRACRARNARIGSPQAFARYACARYARARYARYVRTRFLARLRIDLFLSGRDVDRTARGNGWRHGSVPAVPARAIFKAQTHRPTARHLRRAELRDRGWRAV